MALDAAERALDASHDTTAKWRPLMFAGIARGRLHRTDESAKTLDTLTRLANDLPSDREKRTVHELSGNLALDRGDSTRAVAELKQAEAMLPAMNLPGPFDPPPPQVPIWFALGSAYLAAGNDTEAAARFVRIVNANTMRVQYPVEFVRSLYFLGRVSERRGGRDQASEYYRRYVSYWGTGDLDRAQVAEARKKLGGM
jgi:tetratricopeptide (TPR) repeat protein